MQCDPKGSSSPLDTGTQTHVRRVPSGDALQQPTRCPAAWGHAEHKTSPITEGRPQRGRAATTPRCRAAWRHAEHKTSPSRHKAVPSGDALQRPHTVPRNVGTRRAQDEPITEGRPQRGRIATTPHGAPQRGDTQSTRRTHHGRPSPTGTHCTNPTACRPKASAAWGTEPPLSSSTS